MSQEHSALRGGWRTPVIVLTAGCLIAIISNGVRSSLGIFLEPMTTANGWDRETYALAMAIQHLLWGLGMPVAGALADRLGARWVFVAGAVAYGVGLWGMAVSTDGLMLHLTGGLLAGTGVAFTSFSLAMAAMAKVVGPERRSFALGLGAAAGSAGQVIFSPLGLGFISVFGWQGALFMLVGIAAFIALLAIAIPTDTSAKGEAEFNQSLADAFKEAIVHRGFILLSIGFFVCGFQVSFISVHLPAYVLDLGLPVHVGAYAISLVGLFNILGSFLAGLAGQRWSKKNSLAFLYFFHSVAILGLLLLPKSEFGMYLFACVMGLFWLATVPLTNAIVAQVFGARYMATLFGIVFLSHQLGSFLGVWLGGYLFDRTGSYDVIWWLCIVLGLVATLVHLPIDEKPLPRLSSARAPGA